MDGKRMHSLRPLYKLFVVVLRAFVLLRIDRWLLHHESKSPCHRNSSTDLGGLCWLGHYVASDCGDHCHDDCGMAIECFWFTLCDALVHSRCGFFVLLMHCFGPSFRPLHRQSARVPHRNGMDVCIVLHLKMLAQMVAMAAGKDSQHDWSLHAGQFCYHEHCGFAEYDMLCPSQWLLQLGEVLQHHLWRR